MRIAFVDARYHTFYGAQRSLFTLITNLDFSQIKPIVVLPGDGILATEYRKAGIEVCVLPLWGDANEFGGKIPRLPLYKKLGVGLSLLQYNVKVAWWIVQNRIDVICANDFRALSYVGLAAKLLSKPLLWYVRGTGKPSPLTGLGMHLADRIILIADGVKKAFSHRAYARSQHKFVKLYTGFNCNQYFLEGHNQSRIRQQHNIPNDSNVIGLVASITRNKGHDLLIQALRLLLDWDLNVHVLFVGDSPTGHEDFRKSLDAMVERLGLSPRIHWLGYQQDVAEYYRAMDVLVLPSRSEGLPRTVIEGLAAGLPVVATDVGGVGEILTNSLLGIVVPPDNPQALAQALKTILQDPDRTSDERRKFRRQYVQKNFSIESYVQGFERIVESLS